MVFHQTSSAQPCANHSILSLSVGDKTIAVAVSLSVFIHTKRMLENVKFLLCEVHNRALTALAFSANQGHVSTMS